MAPGKGTFQLFLTNDFRKLDIITLNKPAPKVLGHLEPWIRFITLRVLRPFTLTRINLFHQQTLIESQLCEETAFWDEQRKQGTKQAEILDLEGFTCSSRDGKHREIKCAQSDRFYCDIAN